MLFLIRKLRSPEEEKGGDQKDQKEQEQTTTVKALSKALEEARANEAAAKAEAEKLKTENGELVASIIDGGKKPNEAEQPPKKPDIPALREKLYGKKGKNLTNLEYIESTLQLRQAVIDEGGIDPFLPVGMNIKASESDIEKAEAVAQILGECVKEAKGDSGVFTALLQARIAKDSPALTQHLKKLGIA